MECVTKSAVQLRHSHDNFDIFLAQEEDKNNKLEAASGPRDAKWMEFCFFCTFSWLYFWNVVINLVTGSVCSLQLTLTL